MADFGLACVSQSSEHKVRLASGTAGYACPQYVRTGVITEGSEVYSFGMVLLELLTGMPPAVMRRDNSGDLDFLVERLQGRSDRVMELLDPAAAFSRPRAFTVAEVALRCITGAPGDRPLFAHLVEALRSLQTSAPDARPEAVLRILEPTRRASPKKSPRVELEPVAESSEDVATCDARVPVPMCDLATCDGNVRAAADSSPKRSVGDIATCDANVPAATRDLPTCGNNLQTARDDIQTVFANVEVPQEAPQAEETPTPKPPRCSLSCIYAQGVDLGILKESQRLVFFPKVGTDLVLGRGVQLQSFWSTLVPDEQRLGSFSREHARISIGSCLMGEVFQLKCLSPNGLLLNGSVVRNVDGECALDHGDIIGFSASVATDAGTPCKPFVAFAFRIHSDATDATRERATSGREADRPEEVAIAGRWWSSELELAVPENAIAGLEVFGEHVCMELPKEARQLFLCCAPPPFTPALAPAPALPCLRVGRRRQREFWRMVLEPDFYAEGCWAFLALDHFELQPVWASDQDSTGQSELRFKVRVLSAIGLTLNRTTHLSAGDECGLGAGDALAVGELHFTFMPYATKVAAKVGGVLGFRSESLGDGDGHTVRPLPEDELVDERTPRAGLVGALQTEPSALGPQTRGGAALTAGVLMVPVALDLESP